MIVLHANTASAKGAPGSTAAALLAEPNSTSPGSVVPTRNASTDSNSAPVPVQDFGKSFSEALSAYHAESDAVAHSTPEPSTQSGTAVSERQQPSPSPSPSAAGPSADVQDVQGTLRSGLAAAATHEGKSGGEPKSAKNEESYRPVVWATAATKVKNQGKSDNEVKDARSNASYGRVVWATDAHKVSKDVRVSTQIPAKVTARASFEKTPTSLKAAGEPLISDSHAPSPHVSAGTPALSTDQSAATLPSSMDVLHATTNVSYDAGHSSFQPSSTSTTSDSSSAPAVATPVAGTSIDQGSRDKLQLSTVLSEQHSTQGSGSVAASGESIVTTAPEFAAPEKDVEAFSLTLSKVKNTGGSTSSSEKVQSGARPTATDAAATEPVSGQTSSGSASDEFGDRPKRQKLAATTANAGAPSQSGTKVTAPAQSGSHETGGPANPMDKGTVATTPERSPLGAETASVPTGIAAHSNVSPALKEEARAVQSPREVQPTELQGSSSPTAAKEVVMKIQGSNGETISVRLVDQGGQVQVGVRSSDPNTAASLRQDLSTLTSNLERAGWKAADNPASVPEPVITASNPKPGSDEPETSSNRNYPDWQNQSGKRKPTLADLWDETLDS